MTELIAKKINFNIQPRFYQESVNRIINKFKETHTKEEVVEIESAFVDNKWLYFGTAILASSAVNQNDELFLAEEMWKARFTPIDTPFNIDHNKKNIIGHVTGVRFLDELGEAINEDQQEAPEYFDIEAEFVIYAHIFPEVIKEIEENAKDNNVMVSLEARATTYDFYIEDNKKQELVIVENNEETKFLDKHLRSKKGSGTYNGNKIGRVPRDFTFSGMGHVKVGANKKSVYTHVGRKKIEILNNLKDVNTLFSINTVEDSIYNIAARKNTMNKYETLEDALAEIEKTEGVKASLENQIEVYKLKVEELTASLSALSKDLESTKDAAKNFESQLSEIKAAKLGQDRIAQLEKLGINYGDKRDEKIKGFSSMAPEAFDEVLSLAASFSKQVKEKEEGSAEEITASLETEEVDDFEASLITEKNTKDKKVKDILSKIFQTA